MNIRVIGSILILVFAGVFIGCGSNQSAATSSPSQTPQPTPTVIPISIAQPQSSPEAKQAANKSKANDGVPEMMKRQMTPEEMKKAMEALPPEVRARLQGLGQKPANAAPTATPKK